MTFCGNYPGELEEGMELTFFWRGATNPPIFNLEAVICFGASQNFGVQTWVVRGGMWRY